VVQDTRKYKLRRRGELRLGGGDHDRLHGCYIARGNSWARAWRKRFEI
jgi:hypothetical protein